jgi:precorrin-3B C17-methyltransferase
MSGSLRIVGLGPGPATWRTPAAGQILDAATDVYGYTSYLAWIAPRAGQRFHASDNRVEIERARAALDAASSGRTVAVVSGGDPGVFAMASAVFEAMEHGPPSWRDVDVAVEPGITAMLAAAARAGAPLGHDFCAISLSDNLKPWTLIEKRLRLAAEADFAIALYNPASKARPNAVHLTFAILRETRPPETPVVIARAVGRNGETIAISRLDCADLSCVDMQTLIIVGSSATRILARGSGLRPWVYTPRSMERR